MRQGPRPRHRRAAAAVLWLAGLAACAGPGDIASDTGPSAASGGEVRAVTTRGRRGDGILGITQGRVRACVGRYDPPSTLSPVREVELSCDDGVTGTAELREGPGGRVSYTLSTGESGRVRL